MEKKMNKLSEILSEPVFIGTAEELKKDDLIEVSLAELLEGIGEGDLTDKEKEKMINELSEKRENNQKGDKECLIPE